MTVGAIMIGAALGALDEFERILKTRKTMRPPLRHGPRPRTISAGSAQRSRSSRWRRLRTEAARMQMGYGRATVEDGRPYTFGDDQLIGAIARDAYSDAWQAFQTWIFRYAGLSAGKRGMKMERVLRDMAIGWSHFNTANNEWAYVRQRRPGSDCLTPRCFDQTLCALNLIRMSERRDALARCVAAP